MTNPIQILLVEDHLVVRQGLRLLIETHASMQVIAEASSSKEALEILEKLTPDVVLFDISLPGTGGIEFARTLKEKHPNQRRLLALTANEDRAYFNELLSLGVLGYLLKRSSAGELIKAIETVFRSERFVDSSVVEQLVQDSLGSKPRDKSDTSKGTLSEREQEVLKLIATGYTNKEVARFLEISTKTVETHKARAMAKLEIRSRAELIRYASGKGWISCN
jgi:DNA-binding NarL/FixJ family response regulator